MGKKEGNRGGWCKTVLVGILNISLPLYLLSNGGKVGIDLEGATRLHRG